MRLVYAFATALLAYVVSLVVYYPGYIAWPVPYNPDMYWSVWAVAQGLNPFDLLLWPRPLYFETAFLAGHFGLVGALCVFGAFMLLDLALIIVLFERYLLRRTLPWPVVFATFLLAMFGPGFYKQPGNDIGFHLALLCTLLGVWIWEAHQSRTTAAFCGMAAFFAVSVLSNESLVPGIVVYSAVCAVRARKTPALAAALAALPLLPIAVSLADSQFAHSPFVKFASTGASYGYKIDASPGSMVFWFVQYAKPLVNAGFLVLLAAIGYALWMQRRLRTGAILAAAALVFYVPYTVLPNHFDTTYQWVAMPLLMLLFPLAWVGLGRAAAPRVALALALVFSLLFQRTQALEDKHWNAVTLAQNRSVLAALRAHQSQIAEAHAVLVSGLTFGRWPFQQTAAFLSNELKFAGKWTVTTEPGFAPIDMQPEAQPIDYERVRWSDYDMILMFDREGALFGAFTREQLRAQVLRHGLTGFSYRGIVDRLQFHYPPGVRPPTSWAAGARDGLYLEEEQSQCCFLNGRPTLMLDKPAWAKSVDFVFEVPPTAPFAGRPEGIETYFNGKRAGPAIFLAAGVHRVNFVIPPEMRGAAPLTVTLRMSIAYVPKDLGMNVDRRRLSIKLLRVDYGR